MLERGRATAVPNSAQISQRKTAARVFVCVCVLRLDLPIIRTGERRCVAMICTVGVFVCAISGVGARSDVDDMHRTTTLCACCVPARHCHWLSGGGGRDRPSAQWLIEVD